MSDVTVRWLLAAAHLLALPMAFAAVLGRSAALRREPDGRHLAAVFVADNWWGLSALLFIGTGLARAFLGFEKGSAYYLANIWFWHKMAALLLVLLLEVVPMVTLIRWRIARRRGESIDTRRGRLIAGIGILQAALLVAMVLAATAMARGFGAPG